MPIWLTQVSFFTHLDGIIIALFNVMKTINEIKKILDKEMKSVSDNLDNGIMDSLSLNVVRQKAENIGLFKTQQEALFWFNDNRKSLTRIFRKLNKTYNLPNN